jgi:hypothetical protein
LLAERQVERLIEIGPGSTLVNMAKRTVAAKYHDSDMATGIRRRLLSLKTDAKEIFYEEDQYSHEPDLTSVEAPADVAVNVVSNVPTMPVAATLVVPLAPQPRPTLPSAPVTVAEVVKTIVAATLKVPTAKISMDNTFKGFAAGLFLVSNLSRRKSFKLIKLHREIYSSKRNCGLP